MTVLAMRAVAGILAVMLMVNRLVGWALMLLGPRLGVLVEGCERGYGSLIPCAAACQLKVGRSKMPTSRFHCRKVSSGRVFQSFIDS